MTYCGAFPIKRYRNLSISLIFLSAILLLAGCVTVPNGEERPRFFLTLDPDRTESGTIDDRDNRLLLIGRDGNLYTMDPNGSRRQAITQNASRTLIYQQPTWSPNSQRIAWTQIESRGSRIQPSLMIGQPDGTILNDIDLPFAPFYIYWSPDSERLAYLSNWVFQNSPSLALRLVDLSDEEVETETIAEGQPFYFSWSPNGQELLSHVSNSVVSIYTLQGEQEALSDASSGFPAPQWLTDGERLLFSIDDMQGQGHLVISDRLGTEVEELTSYSGSISFNLAPNEEWLAYTISEQNSGAAGMGSLYVQNLATTSTIELSTDPVLAFFWSPDGKKLAFMQFEVSDNQTGLRWKVWQEDGITEYDTFIPTRVFMRNYLAFFDQYAQSISIWAPDSSAFVYAGSNSVNQRGIFVQKLEEERPTRVSSGVFAIWSPK
ncbi:MAG: hypothetical protein AAF702_51990 [Chloroflexota bacterium]